MSQGGWDRPAWLRDMARGGFHLLVGSLFLLLGAHLARLTEAPPAAILPAIPAVFIHGRGWLFLLAAIGKLREAAGTQAALLATRDMQWVFVLTVLGFGVGLAALLPSLPWSLWLLLGLLLPYVPQVYVPVVAGHALLFLLGSQLLPVGRDATLVQLGSVALLTVAGLAFVVQVFVLPPVALWWGAGPWALYLAGLTSVGYGPVALGWYRQFRTTRADVSWTALL